MIGNQGSLRIVSFLMLASLLSGCGGGSSPATSSTTTDETSWASSASSHFGADGFETVEHRDRSGSDLISAYQWEAGELAHSGIAWDRTLSPRGGQFSWGVIEGTQGVYDWTVPDSFVTSVQAEGLRILALVHPYTPWDQPAKTDMDYDKPNDMDAFRAFIAAMVERYDGDGVDDMPGLLIPIQHYEIGNEPEGSTFGDSPRTYDDFMETVEAACDAAKAASSDVQIVVGGAAPIFDRSGMNPNVDNFWRGALNRQGAAGSFDVFNFHFFVGEYTRDIQDYLEYWKDILAASGLSGKAIWLTETGTYSGSPQGPQQEVWPDQTTEYQAAWWVKQASYALANGIEKLFWVMFYTDQSDWRSNVSFVDADRTTRKPVSYAHRLLAGKLDAFSSATQDSYSAAGQDQTSGDFTFIVGGKPVRVVWNDQGGSATMTGLSSSAVRITSAVPVLDSGGAAVLDANGEASFQVTESAVISGQVAVSLSSTPVYVEGM